MAFTFDIEAAINSIAAVENALTEITTSYGYGANPVVIDGSAPLPAVVHIPLGAQHLDPTTFIPGLLASGWVFQERYDIQCRLLINEVVGKDYPIAEAASNKIWQPIANTFMDRTIMETLSAAAPATDTYFNWGAAPSYMVRPWPPEPWQLKFYWSIDYIITYVFQG